MSTISEREGARRTSEYGGQVFINTVAFVIQTITREIINALFMTKICNLLHINVPSSLWLLCSEVLDFISVCNKVTFSFTISVSSYVADT